MLRRFAPRNDEGGEQHGRPETPRCRHERAPKSAGQCLGRQVDRNAWVDKSIAGRNAFNTDFQDMITRYAWGEIWTRPHFDERTRRVLVIGTMVALGQWDEFRLHVRAALAEGGFTPDDIKEILLQQAIYCGVPATNHAVKEASAIVQELGLLKT
ncbi:4-carboxymuconolactone decarboxylase [Bradyrhizobium sp. LB9.1b]